MRYFKMNEISEEEYELVCGVCPPCYSQLAEPVNGYVYVAIEEDEDEIEVGLDMFDGED